MAKSERNLTAIFQDTADAIRSKTKKTEEINPRDFADEIESIPTGSSEIIPGPNDNVIVYDYDGTVLDAQQVAVGQEYTLPSAPNHEGLVFDGWCSTEPIVNGKITIPVTKDVHIGPNYHTTSGKIELDVIPFINIPVTLYEGYTNVDWGDGTVTTDSNSHLYSDQNMHTIKILSNETTYTKGGNSTNAIINIRLPSTITTISANMFAHHYVLRTIAIPSSITSSAGNDIFNNAYFLKFFVFPKDLTTITATSFFIRNTSLKGAVIPHGVTSIGQQCFYSCAGLEKVILPKNLTLIDRFLLASCTSLRKIKIPKTVTSIRINSFQYTSWCGEFDFSQHQSVPTLESSSFSSLQTGAKIIVPDALYTSWIAATNWSDIASHIVRASEV